MSVKVKYKGEQILSLNTDTEKALATEGQYCEADIVVENVQDGGITPSGSITLAEERSYDVTDKATAVVDMSATRANLAEAVTAKGVDTLPTSSFDTIATNIGLISGGGGLPSSISKIDGGSFSFTAPTRGDNYTIQHSLGIAPKFAVIWCEPIADLSTLPDNNNYIVNYQATFGQWLDRITAQLGIRCAKTGYANDSGFVNYIPSIAVDTTTLKFANQYRYYIPNVTYYWYVIA